VSNINTNNTKNNNTNIKKNNAWSTKANETATAPAIAASQLDRQAAAQGLFIKDVKGMGERPIMSRWRFTCSARQLLFRGLGGFDGRTIGRVNLVSRA